MKIITDLWNILINSAQGSFIQVTVFVGAVLLLFGFFDYLLQGAFIATIEKLKKFQPLIGALLGIIPGCGGSIFLMPLYLKGTVSFGAITATLIATAGDSAFVTMTQAPGQFLLMTGICFVTGIITGYIVDYFKIGEWINKNNPNRFKAGSAENHEAAEEAIDEFYPDEFSECRSCNLKHIGHEEGDEIDMILHHSKPLDTRTLGYRISHHYHIVFWLIISMGFIMGILELAQVDINNIFGVKNLGIIMGGIGTLIILLYMLFSKKLIRAQTHEDEEHKLASVKETFIHNAQETAFVGTWVFFAYLVYELIVYFAGGDQVLASLMVSAGFASVLAGVIVGIIPGCGPQVIFVSLYLKGMFPFAALIANGISQDGDALFPLIAMDRKSAFWATVLNTIPAIIVGAIVYFIEIKFF